MREKGQLTINEEIDEVISEEIDVEELAAGVDGESAKRFAIGDYQLHITVAALVIALFALVFLKAIFLSFPCRIRLMFALCW